MNQYEVIAALMLAVGDTDWGAVALDSSAEQITLILRHDNDPKNIDLEKKDEWERMLEGRI